MWVHHGSLNTDVIMSRLFQTPTQSPSSNPTPPTRRRRVIPFNEVVSVIIKSSRTPISMGTFSPQLLVTFDTYSCPLPSTYLQPRQLRPSEHLLLFALNSLNL